MTRAERHQLILDVVKEELSRRTPPQQGSFPDLSSIYNRNTFGPDNSYGTLSGTARHVGKDINRPVNPDTEVEVIVDIVEITLKKLEEYERVEESKLSKEGRRERLFAQIRSKIYEAFDVVCANDDEKEDFIFEILQNIGFVERVQDKLKKQESEGDFEISEEARERFLSQIKEEIKQAFSTVCTDDAERETFVRELLANIGYPKGLSNRAKEFVSLPEQAPALWLERENRKETPAEFIKREYAPWVGQGLTQAHIRHLDRSLYMALHQWLRWHELPPDLDLPTKKELNDRKLRELGEDPLKALPSKGAALSPEMRESLRLYEVARRRRNSAEHNDLKR
jgi:hypothetical protein